ncbi:hypothetical protein CSB08_00035 [Candidatus Gracilibacteria bacterium]|nr:MAG: hypothetical protein CSB08_00035 [Candidatus Gracilibacteria bacterium]PIE85704.1 MAG: hypothetical protein CSA08_00705 [Candidatus Gracilibacteria bacterium]
MKYFVFLLVFLSQPLLATDIKLYFENGWEVTFDDGIVFEGYSTSYGPPTFGGAAPVHETTLFSATTEMLGSYLSISEVSLTSSPSYGLEESFISLDNPYYTGNNLLGLLDSLLGQQTDYGYSNNLTGVYDSGVTIFTDWEYVSAPPTQVPAPAPLALLGVIGFLLAFVKKKKQKIK